MASAALSSPAGAGTFEPRPAGRGQRLKLLFVYRFCGLGGVETSILNRLDALQTESVDARVIFGEFYGSGGNTLAADPRITIGIDPDRIREVVRAVDVVSIIDYPDFLDYLDGLETPPKVIFETHASLPSALVRFHSRLGDPRISAIVTPADFNKRLVEAALPAQKSIVVIPNAVDATRFRPRTSSFLRRLRSPAQPALLWVGRLEKEKNPDEFIRIGAALLDSGLDLRLMIIGDAYNDAEYEAYAARLRSGLPRKWANRLTLRRCVPYHEMPAVYANVAETGGCLVSTSLNESAPMTFIEAMAAMCPVVSSEVGGVSELVSSGMTYHSGDIRDATAKIRRLLDKRHSSERQALLKQAHAAALQRHAPATVAREYRALLDSIAPPAPTPSHTLPANLGPPQHANRDSVVVPGMVSVIIPVYNRAELLNDAVESVLSQSYRNFEIIIVDDGSTDGTADFCERLARDHDVIRVIHTPHQGRAGLAREAGRRIARGEFIQYLDSDDLIMPEKFERMVAALEASPECDIAYCYTRRYPLDSEPGTTTAALSARGFETISPAFLTRRYWLTSTPLYRRRLCDKAGPWSDLLFWEDIEYDLRLAAYAPRLCHCEEWLTDIRDHDRSRLSGSRFLENPELLLNAVNGSALIYQNLKRAGMPLNDDHVRSFIDDLRLMHNRCLHFGLHDAAQDCAAIIMDATGCADPTRAGEYTITADVEPQVGALRAVPGQTLSCPVRVTNRSTVAFHAGEFATELAYHLRDSGGAMRRFQNAKKIIEEPLRPGESRIIDLPVYAPGESGLYYLELDVLWAGFAWLNASAASKSYVKLLVGESIAERRWWLHLEGDSAAELDVAPPGSGGARVRIHSASEGPPWQVQANLEPLWVIANQEYEVRFRARADESRRVIASVSRTHDGWENLGLYQEIELAPEWRTFALPFRAAATAYRARFHFDAGGNGISFEIGDVEFAGLPGNEAPLPFTLPARLQMDIGIRPLSYLWGRDRGLAVHRYYLEQFLHQFTSDIQGRCLEFQDPEYVPRFGGTSVESLDILHIDHSSPYATLVADLTRPNDLPEDRFDCIVCTHVLHVIVDVRRAISELCRILKPGGVLLIAVPHISMYGPDYGEIWRFTPAGLEALLSGVFGQENVIVLSYGNSLTAAGEIRGVVASEFLQSELDAHDWRFPVEVCARAVKAPL